MGAEVGACLGEAGVAGTEGMRRKQLERMLKRTVVLPSRTLAPRGRTVASILDEMGATRRL